MAKPKKKRNGSWTIMATFRGQRRNLSLGKMPKSDADLFSSKLKKLIEYRKYSDSTLPPELQIWVEQLGQRHAEQLSELNLFDSHCRTITVAQLFDAFTDWYPTKKKPDGRPVSESSIRTIERALKRFPKRFTSHQLNTLEPQRRSLRTNAEAVFTSEAEAIFADLNSWQRNHYAASTWSRDNGRIREVGGWAVKRGYCDYNPFTLLPSPGEVNSSRNEFLTQEMVEDAIAACYDIDTRLTFVLGRFSGLRTPSELRTLKWSYVDFESSQLSILDSKKQKLRTMPLFDRVRAALERQHTETGKTRFVMSERFRSCNDSNNYNLVSEAIVRSGQPRWSRLRQNLRTSCENDLLKVFPERLVCEWLGHTVKVSRKHYQKQTAADYLEAITKARKNAVFT